MIYAKTQMKVYKFYKEKQTQGQQNILSYEIQKPPQQHHRQQQQ